jgi:hypothetical protein
MDKISRKREREEFEESKRDVKSRIDSENLCGIKREKKEKNGYDFEKEVSKILRENGFIVYNENFQKNEFIKSKKSERKERPSASQRVYEIDILMYKTIIECKNLYL